MSYEENIYENINKIPECCRNFILTTGAEKSVSTRSSYLDEIRHFFDYIIKKSDVLKGLEYEQINKEILEDITSEDISRYITHCMDQGLKEKTVARKRAALSSLFNYLVKNKIISFNPVLASTKVKIHQSDELTYIDIKQQNLLLNCVENGSGLDDKKLLYHEKYKARDTAIIMLLLDTGMRVSELHNLDIADFNSKECSVTVLRKGGNTQTLYFSDETTDLIKASLAERTMLNGDDPLFVTKKGDRLSIRAIQELVKKYTAASGKKLSPHKLRTSFAMEYYDETKDILDLQRKLGHKSLAATNIYAKATDKKMRETRNVMAEKRKRG